MLYVGHMKGFVWRQSELCVFRAQLRLRIFIFGGSIMKRTQKIVSSLLALLLIQSILPMGLGVQAAYENNHINTGDQRLDIVAVAQTQYGYPEGSNKDNKYGAEFDGNHLNWCAFFVSWCAKQADIPDNVIHRQGIASPYSGYFNIPNTHGNRDYFPEPGDLVFYDYESDNNHDHVGLVETVDSSTGYITTLEGNSYYDENNKIYQVCRHTRHYQDSRICCYGIPNYTDSTSNPVDLGTSFYASIINTETWKHLTNDSPNVSGRTEILGNSTQYWYFYRKDDGSYSIRSASNGQHLTATGTSSGSNIQVAAWTGSDSQYWWITGESAKYVLTPKSGSCVLSLPNANGEEGTNIQLETRDTNNNDAQLFQIWKRSDYMMSPNVRTSQSEYVKDSDITIKWSECLGAETYWLDIWKAGTNGAEATHIHSLSFNGDTFSYTMPSVQNGSYTVFCKTTKSSSTCQFIVADNTMSHTPANLGDDFYAVILTKNAWKPIANDYETDNFVRLQTGEHEKNSAHQLWRFQRQNDGTYVIRSVQDGNCLEFCNAQYGVRAENDPVTAQEPWSKYARQKWWIYESSNGGYFLESYHYSSEGWYMTLKDDSSEDGTPITMCSFLTSNDNQTWGIYAKSEVQLKAPTLTVNAGTTSAPVQFSWDHVFGAKDFQVKIWKAQYDESKAPDFTDTVTTTSSSIQLPAGTYVASVTASNYWESYTSQIVEFTVNEDPHQVVLTGDADGDGQVVLKDVTCLRRYLAGGWGVTVDAAAADVNKDGSVDLRDVTILRRYLAGGWGIVLK